MRLKNGIIFFMVLTIILSSFVFAQNKASDLKPKYKKWLELVHYIITPQEKEVFFALKSDRERDTFIKLFWKQRDPTPGTPENEFKEEIIKRFNYANKYFKYGSTKPGWKTDMGRIYIILGPPVNRERIDAYGLQPMEVWSYYGDSSRNLPPHFRIVFFKRHGTGEFKIYDPAIDGPDSLLVKTSEVRDISPFDYATIYEKIQQIDPSAAEPALSLIPGEIPLNYQPSPSNTILISKVLEAGRKNINVKYARDFLNFKGVVSVEYATEYVNSVHSVDIFKDIETGFNFVHFTILPKRISVDYSEVKDKYYFIYKLTVSLSKSGKIIYQYTKNFPFYFNESEIRKVVAKGFAISDLFPIIPGRYKLTVLIQNTVKKEFSYFDKNIEIKGAGKGIPRIYGPLLGYKIINDSSFVYRPYKIENTVVSVDPNENFLPTDNIYVFYCIDAGGYEKTIKSLLEIKNRVGYRAFSFRKRIEINKDISEKCFTQRVNNPGAGGYSVKISLLSDKEIPFEIKEKSFNISPVRNFTHPTLAFKRLIKSNSFLYYWTIGSQYKSIGEFAKSVENYSKAFKLRSNYPPLTKEYSELLIQLGKNNQALNVLESLKGEKYLFDYYFLKGIALFNLGKYRMARDTLLKANDIYDSDYKLLNYLGLSFWNLGDYDNAIKALRSSLKINTEQEMIKKLVKKLNLRIKKR